MKETTISTLIFQQRSQQDSRQPVSQRRSTGGKILEDNRANFTAQLAKEDEEPLQAKFADTRAPLQRAEPPSKPNKTGLPDNLKNGIESLSGMSMDNVRVHYNSSQPAQLNALAYAQGTDIHVAPGQEKHLPHEAWHVVQQAQGRVQPTMQMKEGVAVNDDKGLEAEADLMGGRAVQLASMTRTFTTVMPSLNRAMSSVQRLMRPAPVIGSATSYHVSAADLGNGTGTTTPVRVWTQANAPGPNQINFRYATSNAAGTAVGAWNGPFTAPNPAPAGGGNWHAGHILARQNGGYGHLSSHDWIVPQNPQVNMGHGGYYNAWRAHEVAFHNLVAGAGYGVWDVW